MPAIPTIDQFTVAGMPGWTVTAGAFTSGSGAAVPTNFGITNTAIRDVSIPDQPNASPCLGFIAKYTLGGGCEPGTVYRFIIDYTDANNLVYAEVRLGLLKPSEAIVRDEVKIWQVIGGAFSEIGENTPLESQQYTPGDMRLYKLIPGSDFGVGLLDP